MTSTTRQFIHSVSLKKLGIYLASSILLLILGAPAATELFNGAFGPDFPYGQSLLYSMVCILAGWFLVSLLLVGLKAFNSQK